MDPGQRDLVNALLASLMSLMEGAAATTLAGQSDRRRGNSLPTVIRQLRTALMAAGSILEAIEAISARSTRD